MSQKYIIHKKLSQRNYNFYDPQNFISLKIPCPIYNTRGLSNIWLLFTLQLFNLGTLIAASIAVTAINEVAELYNENGAEYENAGSYRAVAGWLIFVASAAIIFHVIALIILVFYMSSTVKKHIKLFAAVVSDYTSL